MAGLFHLHRTSGRSSQRAGSTGHRLTAKLETADTHCTLAKRALSEVRLELDNSKKKHQPRQSVKTRGRFLALPKLRDDFEKAEAERRDKEKADTEKQAKKKAADEARQSQIEHDTKGKTFDGLSTFRCKDDYITLAGALGISRDGTVLELKARMKGYLADPSHTEVAQNPRFAAFFQAPPSKTRSCNTPQNVHSDASPASGGAATGMPLLDSAGPGLYSHHTQPYTTFTLQLQHDLYGTYNYFPPHDIYRTYSHFQQVQPYDTTYNNASQVASSSNLDRQPHANVGIPPSSFSLSSTFL